MGLAERRAAKDFQDQKLPGLTSDLASAAGFSVPLEIDWEKLQAPDYAHLYEDAWTKVYFTPLFDALKAITVDDLGREALKEHLKKIVITNSGGIYYGDRMTTFSDGVLTLDHEPCTNVDDVEDRKKWIQTALEKAL